MTFTLLCLDDDAKSVSALEAALPDGVALIACADPDEAFELLVVEQPELVVVEPRLRQANGLDFVERMRGSQSGEVAATPVIVVTRAGRTPGVHGRAMQLGVAEYLGKPAPRSELARVIRAQLEKGADARAREAAPAAVGIGAGRLADLPLAELLDRVHRRAESGVLIVGDARERTGIQIRNGSPVAVRPASEEGIDDFLIRKGRLSEEERDAALAHAPLGLGTVEGVLLDAGVIDEDALDAALAEQADEAVFALFELPKGRYRFEPGRRLKGARSLDLTRSAQSFIVRGVLARAPLEKVSDALHRYADLYVASNPEPDPTPDDVPCSEAQRDFLAGLTGDRCVADFLEGSEFELRTLYAFAILGAVALSAEPMLVLDDAAALEPASAGAGAAAEAAAAEEEEILDLDEPIEEEPDLSHEDTLFEGASIGAWEAAPAPPDLSHEDDLFEERAFEEDSFEQEMVAEESSREQSLLEIDELVAGAGAEPELAPEPEVVSVEAPALEAPEEAEEASETPEQAELEPRPESASAEPEAAEPEEPELETSEALEDVSADEEPLGEDVALEIDHDLGIEEEPELEVDEDLEQDALDSDAFEEEEPGAAATTEATEEAPRKEPSRAGRYSVDAATNEHARETVVVSLPEPEPQPQPAPEPERTPVVDEPPAEEPVAAAAAEPSDAEEPAREAPREPEPEPVPAPPPPRPATRSSGYEIAPMGTVQTDPAERALIAARVQKRLDRRYAQLLERKKSPTEAASSTPSEASRALEAESWFRKGSDLLKLKRYDEAVEAFGMSAHQDPNEGEYVAHLGYALYLSKPDDTTVRKEALEDIARGIKLSPDREMPYVYLGRIFKVQGELDNARKMFRRALKIRPNCRQAEQELRLMDMRDQKKSGGLLGRFLKS